MSNARSSFWIASPVCSCLKRSLASSSSAAASSSSSGPKQRALGILLPPKISAGLARYLHSSVLHDPDLGNLRIVEGGALHIVGRKDPGLADLKLHLCSP